MVDFLLKRRRNFLLTERTGAVTGFKVLPSGFHPVTIAKALYQVSYVDIGFTDDLLFENRVGF